MAEVGVTYSTGVRSTIGALTLDAMVTEGTELKARASEYAVEEGSPISDHVTIESERLKVSGVITGNDVLELTADGRPKMMEAKSTLRKILNDRALITITTGMDTYADMIMETCSIGRSSDTGEQLTVDCEFVKIRKATLRKASIPPDKVSGTAAKGKAGETKTKAGKTGSDEPDGPHMSKLYRKLNTP